MAEESKTGTTLYTSGESARQLSLMNETPQNDQQNAQQNDQGVETSTPSDDGYNRQMYEFAEMALEPWSDFDIEMMNNTKELQNAQNQLSKTEEKLQAIESGLVEDDPIYGKDYYQKRKKTYEDEVTKYTNILDEYGKNKDLMTRYMETYKDRYENDPDRGKEEDVDPWTAAEKFKEGEFSALDYANALQKYNAKNVNLSSNTKDLKDIYEAGVEAGTEKGNEKELVQLGKNAGINEKDLKRALNPQNEEDVKLAEKLLKRVDQYYGKQSYPGNDYNTLKDAINTAIEGYEGNKVPPNVTVETLTPETPEEPEVSAKNYASIWDDFNSWYEGQLAKLDQIDTKNITDWGNIVDEVSGDINEFSSDATQYLSKLMEDLVGMTIEEYQAFYNSEKFGEFSNSVLGYAQRAKEKIHQIKTEAQKQGYERDDSTLAKLRYGTERILAKVNLHTKLSEDEAYNVDSWLRSLDACEEITDALIGSSAFNGAEDVKGSEYVEGWKDQVNKFFDAKAVLAAGAKGALGLLTTTVGFGLIAVNPGLAAVAIGIGTSLFGASSLKVALGQEQKEATNRELMFNPENKKSIELWNRVYAPYNVGDKRAISTYTEMVGAGAESATGLSSLLTNPLMGAALLIDASQKVSQLIKGSTDTQMTELYQNVYQAAVYFDNAFGEEISSRFNFSFNSETDDEEDAYTPSSFDIETEGYPIEGKYSGYRENAKNSNLATDYNAGMEEETNEAVSDMRMKIYKVYSKEPDYIKKAIAKVLKSYAEII